MDELFGAIQRAVASTKPILIFGDSTSRRNFFQKDKRHLRNKLNEDFKTRRVWTIRGLDIMEIPCCR